MSNHLAIATVTAALQRILIAAVQRDIGGAQVTTNRPSNLGSGVPETRTNLYLYQVARNPMFDSHATVRSRSRSGLTVKRSRTAWNLHYLLSFYGNEMELEPQRLLGSAVRVLSDRPALTKEIIRDTLADATLTHLADSTLAEQVEKISIEPLDLSWEDLSKIWSVFFQTPYTLSIAYRATVVIIEGEEAAKVALPVGQRQLAIAPFRDRPTIERVVPQTGQLEPILTDSTLLIKGRDLQASVTRVLIGGVEVAPQAASQTEIILPLSSVPTDSLSPGVQSLQVIHRQSEASVPSDNGSQKPVFITRIESNPAPFVLRPIVTKVTVSKLEGQEEEVRSALIKVRVNLAIGKKQRAILILNEKTSSNPAAYLFEAAPRRVDRVQWINFPIGNVKPGEYLVRLQVDGAESVLSIDTNPQSKTYGNYSKPRLTIR